MNKTEKLVEALGKIVNERYPIKEGLSQIQVERQFARRNGFIDGYKQALELYKDGWVSVNVKFDEGSVILENERGDRYKSESESLIDFFMLSEQPLPSPPQTKTI